MPNADVIGLGKSGIAAARLLQRQGWTVTLSDANTSDALERLRSPLEAEGITVRLNHSFDPAQGQRDRIIVSPGVPWDLPALEAARQQGIETWGEMELAWRSLSHRPWVGITGTNGKTTTTALVAAIFQAAGFYAPPCGNIGYAACELALGDKVPDWVIAEISSYQIESSQTLAPRIGVWTTFTPDHLNRHYTLDNYHAIKAKLLHQSEFQVLNGDDPYLRRTGGDRFPAACWTSGAGRASLVANPDRGVYLEDGWVVAAGTPIVQARDLRMVGAHNLQNLLMAVAVARLAEIDPEAIAHAIQTFPGVSHRLEHITTWQGVDYINDSKATNYDAAEVGLAAVAAPVILIAGGDAKAGDDTGWLRQIQQKAAAVLLIGDAAPTFAARLQQVGYETYDQVETMEAAIARSKILAPHYGAKTVLLSPACASFDQYPNFEARGDHFRQLCQVHLMDD
jgi:UDP-N-acetylmuramoylalanine--D-glutamate ligase